MMTKSENLEALTNRRDELLVRWRKGDRSEAVAEEFRDINRRIRELNGPTVIVEKGWVDSQTKG